MCDFLKASVESCVVIYDVVPFHAYVVVTAFLRPPHGPIPAGIKKLNVVGSSCSFSFARNGRHHLLKLQQLTTSG